MSDLIERQKAIDLCDWYDNPSMHDDLEKLPSVQPEIVRCMDCENWIPGYITDNDDFIPPKCGKYQQMVGHNSDDYCSLAERRTDEGDCGTSARSAEQR